MTDVIDVEALTDELTVEQEKRRKLADHGPVEYAPGCRLCGCSVSPDLYDGLHWADGTCARCRPERWDCTGGDDEQHGRTDKKPGEPVIRRMLDADERLRHWHAGQAVERARFRWFSEVDDAEPSPDTRWAYLGALLPDMVARLLPPKPGSRSARTR